jgi:hypothetical protein
MNSFTVSFSAVFIARSWLVFRFEDITREASVATVLLGEPVCELTVEPGPFQEPSTVIRCEVWIGESDNARA